MLGPTLLASFWSPGTDAGVMAQIAATIVLVAVLAWLTRSERSVVLLVIGVGTVALAWYGVRALH